MSEKIGILGGSFNPPHIGHIAAAKNAACALSLSRVIFIPSNIPPHKNIDDDTPSGNMRLEMVRLAITGEENFEVSDIELISGGISYTEHTLSKLKVHMPGAQFFFIMGTDMFLSFDTWYRFLDIAKLCIPVALPRGESDLDALLSKQARFLLESKIESIVLVAPILSISSTELRSGFRSGAADKWVSPEVLSYIEQNKLYGRY